MTSPFHAGDVGSAIALAKAKGFPLLVAVHTPGDASSDALESVWRDDAVASELRSRWVALRLERLDGDRGADFRSFAALFPVAGAHAVVAINPGDGAVLFERAFPFPFLRASAALEQHGAVAGVDGHET